MFNRPIKRSFTSASNGVRLSFLFFLLATLCFTTQQANGWQSRRVQPDNRAQANNRQTIATKNTLRVENLRGNIQIQLTNRTDIEIVATRRVGGMPLRAEELSIEQTTFQASVTVRETELGGGIDLKIGAPVGTGLRLFSDTGNIFVDGVAASLMAKTSRGNIELNLPERANLDLDITAENGSIDFADKMKFYGSYSANAMYGRLGEGGAIYTAHTSRGQIHLRNSLDNQVADIRQTKRTGSNRNDNNGDAEISARQLPPDTNDTNSENIKKETNSSSIPSARPIPIPSPTPSSSSAKPDLSKPDLTKPKPEPAKSGSASSGRSSVVIPPVLRRPPPRQSESRQPESPQPDLDESESDRPETTQPEIRQPVTRPAPLGKPELRRPELRRPESTNEPVGDEPVVNNRDTGIGDDNVLRIESRLVTLNASVSTTAGKPVFDLKKEDFKLYEDKVEQEIVHFQSAQTPFNLVLLIDLSGSLRDKLPLIRRAAWRFVQATRPEDKVAVVTFTSVTRVASQLTSDREELRRRIDKINKPEGGTNFYDAIEDTLNDVLASVHGQRNAVVLMTDGVDNALPGIPGRGSQTSFQDMRDHVMEADTLMFPIYIDTEQEAVEDLGDRAMRAYEIARNQLKELADATGGAIFYAQRVEDLEGRYEEVAAALRTVYSLGYYPNNSDQQQAFHRINVRVNRDGTQVRTRRGYYSNRN